ncbi:MAG: molybdate ABC transporter substrate-binding protein [Acidobacteria bacterium]|nr:molybdate ABC transporter substrate-binding protein [Acidobacteriota bacterium]
MKQTILFLIFFILVSIIACSSAQKIDSKKLTIAAAANVEPAFKEIAKEFQLETGAEVVFSFGASGMLAKQIENAAPFDLFVSADVKTVEALEAKGEILPGTKRIYARGKLVLTWPQNIKLVPLALEDIVKEDFRRIAIATPDIAPYGAAAKESLQNLGVWEKLEPRIVYGENVSSVYQYIKTGNVELGFIPMSLIKPGENFLAVDEKLHKPINQALGVVKKSKQIELAKDFDRFLTGQKAQHILEKFGYSIP